MLASIDLESGLEEAWQDVVTFAPKLLGFFLILLIGWFVAKALSKAADALLERVGFDGWVERGSVKAAFDRSKTDASDLIGVIVFWIVFLITLQLAFGIWGPNPISDLLAGVIAYLPNLIVAVIILVIAAMLARVVTDILTPTLGAVQGGETIARLAGLAILVLGIFAALDQLEIAPMIVTGLFYALLVVMLDRWSSPSAAAVSRSPASTSRGGAFERATPLATSARTPMSTLAAERRNRSCRRPPSRRHRRPRREPQGSRGT